MARKISDETSVHSKQEEQQMSWSDLEKYPIGTKAYSVTGGYWIRTERGWKWCNGDTFPTPGGDVGRVELPIKESNEST